MAKVYEKSAGGVVYRKTSTGEIEVLLLQWLNARQQKEFVVPKGHLEGEETANQAALRETSEETGLDTKDLEIIKFITKLNYTFTAGHLKNNPVVDKDVYLFLIKYHGDTNPVPQKEERFVGYKWINIKDIEEIDVKFDLHSLITKNKVYFL